MAIIAVANQKGGVGKTTSTLNLGAALAEAGERVLLVDLDPQGNLSVATGLVDIDAAYPSMGDLLALAARGRASGGPRIEDAIVHSPAGLDVIPANASLSAAELALVSALSRESVLAGLLKRLDGRYDHILIDCLPSLGLLAINALNAADGVLIPVQADFLAMQGLAQIFETIAAVREQLHPELSILGVLLTMVDQRTAHAREVVRTVRTSLAGQVRVFESEVRLHVALKETAKVGRSILDYDSASPSAAAYRGLAHEVLVALGLAEAPVDAEPLVPQAADSTTADADRTLTAQADRTPTAEADSGPLAEVAPSPSPSRVPLAEAPEFESFLMDQGWQRWLDSARV